MSILNSFRRSMIKFDVTNKDHRRFAAEFFKNHTWKNCPVQFFIDPAYDDLVTMITDQMLTFYSKQEFYSAD